MRVKRVSSLLAAALVAVGGMTALPAQAVTKYTWTPGAPSKNGSGSWYDGNTSTSTADGGISFTATAWSNTDGTTGDTNKIQEATLGGWTSSGFGLGVYNQDAVKTSNCPSSNGNTGSADNCEDYSPEHSVDNNGRYDSILYSFNQAIQLTDVSLSWSSTDSDITVLAYTGSQPFALSALKGLTYSELTDVTDLLTKGWTLVGHYADLVAGTPKAVNDGSQTAGKIITSSQWLIGAYNDLVGGTTTNLSKGNDYVKIGALKGVKPPPQQQVPEPGSLALLGLGGLLLARARYRRG